MANWAQLPIYLFISLIGGLGGYKVKVYLHFSKPAITGLFYNYQAFSVSSNSFAAALTL
jgi:hypothetical protein